MNRNRSLVQYPLDKYGVGMGGLNDMMTFHALQWVRHPSEHREGMDLQLTRYKTVNNQREDLNNSPSTTGRPQMECVA